MAFQLGDRLKDWMEAAVGCPVAVGPPSSGAKDRSIVFSLLSLERMANGGAMRPQTHSLVLRYLVTACAQEPSIAHATLADAAFAALESNDYDVEAEVPPLELWRAFGMAPQPAFLLRAYIHRERIRPKAKPVLHPVRVEVVARTAFFGKVVGPGDVPLANCSVAVPALGLATQSDREGQFSFAGLPTSGEVQFRLRARNHEMSVQSERAFSDRSAPMLIRFNVLEE